MTDDTEAREPRRMRHETILGAGVLVVRSTPLDTEPTPEADTKQGDTEAKPRKRRVLWSALIGREAPGGGHRNPRSPEARRRRSKAANAKRAARVAAELAGLRVPR